MLAFQPTPRADKTSHPKRDLIGLLLPLRCGERNGFFYQVLLCVLRALGVLRGEKDESMTGYFISIGNIIIDDIILPDGSSRMGTLGGGATHAVMGMRIWTEHVGLVTPVGTDFGGDQLAGLAERFDLHGLVVRPHDPTPRAWQLFETDGTRNEIFRTSYEGMAAMNPQPEDLPAFYSNLAGVHLHCAPQDVARWVPVLRQRGNPIILWEPWDPFCAPEHRETFREFSPLVDIVSPNLKEGRHLTGLIDPADVVHCLQDYGAPLGVLRMGAEGSLVSGYQRELYPIPACCVERIVDVTGAGNAFCGGFIVGLALTGDLQRAGWYGGVSASMALGQFGAVYPLAGAREEAQRRLGWYESSSKL
jgi:sugar/nucleoside kinase (ribokinase family)